MRQTGKGTKERAQAHKRMRSIRSEENERLGEEQRPENVSWEGVGGQEEWQSTAELAAQGSAGVGEGQCQLQHFTLPFQQQQARG